MKTMKGAFFGIFFFLKKEGFFSLAFFFVNMLPEALTQQLPLGVPALRMTCQKLSGWSIDNLLSNCAENPSYVATHKSHV